MGRVLQEKQENDKTKEEQRIYDEMEEETDPFNSRVERSL
jgi:hypothetical protein